MRFIWLQDKDIPELSTTFVGTIKVQKLITQKGTRYSIGDMETSLIKFDNVLTLYKFLTI
jgi:hypothetical protein